MIVVPIQLYSAIDGSISNLGTLIISNMGTHPDPKYGDYRIRMYKKGDLEKSDNDPRKMMVSKKTYREARLLNHHRAKKPVASLVQRALDALEF